MTEDWDAFGISKLPPLSARRLIEQVPPPLQPILDERTAQLHQPFTGVTTNGDVVENLFPLQPTAVSTAPIVEAGLAFLESLNSAQRARATFEMNSIEWRTWINVHMNHFRHGVMLEDLDTAGRQAGMRLLRACLSDHGFGMARSIMEINEFIVGLGADADSFGEWPYFVSVFGDPGANEPWGFQFDGHHLNVNCVVVGDQVVITPQFMGSEPRRISRGPLAGTALFDDEEQGGIDLIRSFDDTQRDKAILRPSIQSADLPSELNDMFDGRVIAGAFHDNAVMPYGGVAGSDMTDGQRAILTRLIAAYVDRAPTARAEIQMADVANHLDDTWFQWFGGTTDADPFYYRVHGPIMLIEFDHHPGVVFDNREPSRNHIHTLVRTPNGGDYGHSLLAQHHERFDHSHGGHTPRHEGSP